MCFDSISVQLYSSEETTSELLFMGYDADLTAVSLAVHTHKPHRLQ